MFATTSTLSEIVTSAFPFNEKIILKEFKHSNLNISTTCIVDNEQICFYLMDFISGAIEAHLKHKLAPSVVQMAHLSTRSLAVLKHRRVVCPRRSLNSKTCIKKVEKSRFN